MDKLLSRKQGYRLMLAMAAAVLVSACQTTPQIDELEQRNTALQNQLEEAEREVQVLRREENRLQDQVQELESLAGVLATEKSSRVQESSELRQQVRRFVQQQIDDLKKFLVNGNLLDYVGSELVERSYVDAKPLTLVDLAHPMPRAGSLTGVTGFFSEPSSLSIKVLRPVDGDYVVIWESGLLRASSAGEQTLQLPVSVGVEPGDVIAYDFPEVTAVSYDKGTGDTRYTTKDLVLGAAVKRGSLAGEDEKRAYSLGIYAILD